MRHKTNPLQVACAVLAFAAIFVFIIGMGFPNYAYAQEDDPSPPTEPVKLIFIHHSTGENWLTDGYGDLGIVLGENNYFVSDTNYGWGPDSIGDATDIINWPQWFRSDETPRYMQALFNESGQNASYTRNLADPGGENQIVMFKSCFPNSMLEGNPNDPPSPGLDFTVGNAKYIYNDLLNYFVTRPDKLFVVITAPPVQDPSLASNARAFNTWLMQDWLRENNYALNNVAVFDFYNVLTHPGNHHHVVGGHVEYINSQGSNTLYYPSDDDHPNVEGSRKATEEFVPLLNVFYHRWVSGAPAAPPPVQESPPPAGETPSVGVAPVAISSDMIDDFESEPVEGTTGWEPYWDEGGQTTMACAAESGVAHSGSYALHLNFSIAPEGWATCTMLYDQGRDWSSATGLSFLVHASQPGLVFDVNAYKGEPGALEGYIFTLETTPEMVDGWGAVEVPWDVLLRAPWEAEAGTPFDPSLSTGMAFGFGAPEDATNAGELWIDEVRLMEAEIIEPQATPVVEEPTAPTAPPSAEEAPEPTEEEPEEEDGGGLCPLSPALAVLAGAFGLWTKKKRK